VEKPTTHRSSLAETAVILAAVLLSCTRPPEDGATGEETGGRATPTASPTETLPPPTIPPAGATSGAPNQTCVQGWETPADGSQLWTFPLNVIQRTMRFNGTLRVVDMRYFEGPEAPPSDKLYIGEIRRWYVKGFVRANQGLRGRWLVEARRFGSGVSAVASYDSRGWRSPDWMGFEYETAGRYAEPREYPGLPGEWVGKPYDFVKGVEAADETTGEGLENQGLPREVVGCLAGT
jgi:hypothetical protein